MTVSRVINGEQVVRESTRHKVQQSIAALNYAPNAAARSLAGAEETRIALLYSNPSAAYLSEFLVGGLEQARRSDAHLVVEEFDEDDDVRAALDQVLGARIDGVILPPPLCDLPEMRAAMAALDLPAVAVACGRVPEGLSAVNIDDERAAGEMTRHLLDLGHRRIGFIRGNPNQGTSGRRFEGYAKALAEHGVEVDAALVQPGLFTYRSGLEAAERLLDLAARPTAIFASNDDMAAAVVAVAHRRGWLVPDDLTVCGFDDTAMATTIWPELTTIRQPIREMSQAAVELLAADIRSRKAGAGPRLECRLLEHRLVRRHSDARPPS